MMKRWIEKKPARDPVFDTKKKGYPNKPRTPVTLAQYMPKVLHQHETDILRVGLNTKEKHVEVGECAFPVVEGSDEIQIHKATSFTTEITFKDEDLLLGGTPHNRPLFVEGYAREQKIKRILIDQGSSVNILSLQAVKELGISTDELSQSRLMIQGFNQGGQRALGIIRLDLRIGSLSSSTLCYVIDARTSYNLLLGQPWIHENGVVPSSWHQCLMFEKGGVIEKVVPDEIPFTDAESYFADAKFYLKKQVVEDDVDKSSNDTPPDPKWKGNQVVDQSHCDQELVFPLTRIEPLKATPVNPLEDQVRVGTSQTLPVKRTDGFDPNAYKLLFKAGFDPKEPQKLGRLIPEAGGRGKSNQQEPHARKGLGYVLPKLVRIFINRGTSNYITHADEEEVTASQNEVASSFHITLCDETPIEGEDAEEAPHELEGGVQAAIDELKEIDLGTTKNPRPILISTLLSNEDEKIYVELLKEYIDVFAWTYKEMPGLDPKVAVHRLVVKKACRPVKQAQRRFRPELIPSIEGEVNKLIEAGFIREVKYPTWISSIVPVRKKNGQIRVCVNFRDLNVACPKDDIPLPITELMIDVVTGHEIMSFMDGSSGYNQIRMALEDEELTAFRTPKGIYCYKVMPFGLKNASATYQRAM
ncbi:uncharacterized protein LOC115995960 [Ipomoea triloba]|uniref:uncharacterized protein LOC115995960 n=1 Tax=Ipomoea triloba TaxID=35885 RepID=UPI00125E5081|nr:uncharacterized protein LOC115995960 [Ipomoea triloba]